MRRAAVKPPLLIGGATCGLVNAGSASTVYRLSVTTGPYARGAFPACVPRTGKTQLRLTGWNFPSPDEHEMSVGVDPSGALWAHVVGNDSPAEWSTRRGRALRTAKCFFLAGTAP